ncbi:MAG: DUF1572 family protein [Ferruginibacter sp.]
MDQYLDGVKNQFLYYKILGEKAIDQLEDEQLFIQHDPQSNSIAVIIKHMAGNMLSRWTDFLTSDGEKSYRNRDEEFNEQKTDRSIVMKMWNAGWDCLFTSLNQLQTKDLSTIVFIRNEGHTVVDAINRQLAHYPYHVGQIIFYAKQLKKEEWNNLSIPRNKSVDYNKEKFSKEKAVKNYTEEEIKKLL